MVELFISMLEGPRVPMRSTIFVPAVLSKVTASELQKMSGVPALFQLVVVLTSQKVGRTELVPVQTMFGLEVMRRILIAPGVSAGSTNSTAKRAELLTARLVRPPVSVPEYVIRVLVPEGSKPPIELTVNVLVLARMRLPPTTSAS